jgi:hypothetical protein
MNISKVKKGDIETFLQLNRYLTINRNDAKKSSLLRCYMRLKVQRMLNKDSYPLDNILRIPLNLIMF